VSLLSGTVALGAQARQTTPPPTQTPAPAAAASNDIVVTVNYTGKGVVDAGHSVLVFLFTDPNIGPTSQPIGPPQVATRNGAVVTFKGLAARPLYVVGVFNEKGTYNGGGPPPAGLPIGIYRKDAQSPPTAVTPGPKTAVKLTFNEAKRWGQ
jgi:hypothetical protein